MLKLLSRSKHPVFKKIVFLLKTILSAVFVLCFLLPVAVIILGCGKAQLSDHGRNTDTTGTPESHNQSDIALWLTRADKSVLFEKQNIDLNFSDASNNYPTIAVDTTQSYQMIDGFGYCLTGGSAYLIRRLPAEQRAALLRELFSTDSTGIGISYLRISIGASDLNRRVFSYDDLPTGQTDPHLQYFDLSPDKEDLIPLLKEILKINPKISILGSPWSPPAWMKTNKSTEGGNLDPRYYGVYARYFVKYIQEMKANGINIDAMTIQNEPLNPNNNPSMVMQAADEANFIKNYLGPAFDSAKIKTKIIVYDHNCDRPDYPLTILKDEGAAKYVDGSAFHLYAGSIDVLSKVHDAFPDKHVYFTEQWTGGPGHFAGDLSWHVKNLIIGATRNWSRNALEWNLASDPNYDPHTPGGCTSCMGALTIGSDITRNVSYYIIASASKFVRPGSVRIGSNISGTLQNVAFKNPEGKIVLIVLNEGNQRQDFNIQYAGKLATTSLEAGAVGTYVWSQALH